MLNRSDDEAGIPNNANHVEPFIWVEADSISLNEKKSSSWRARLMLLCFSWTRLCLLRTLCGWTWNESCVAQKFYRFTRKCPTNARTNSSVYAPGGEPNEMETFNWLNRLRTSLCWLIENPHRRASIRFKTASSDEAKIILPNCLAFEWNFSSRSSIEPERKFSEKNFSVSAPVIHEKNYSSRWKILLTHRIFLITLLSVWCHCATNKNKISHESLV